ncbi:MAG: DNA polymerase III subunit delta [Caulobacterales bacterium]
MKRAGAEALAFAAKPQKDVWGALVFGKDRTAVKDAADQIAAKWLGGPEDAFSTARLGDSDLRSDPLKLVDELQAQSLFGGERLVRVRLDMETAGAAILNIFADLESGELPVGGKLLIEAGDLTPKSNLRGKFEGAKKAAALHIYGLEEGGIGLLLDSALSEQGASIEDDARHAFVTAAAKEQALVRSEVEKLSLFGRNLGRAISAEDLVALGVTEREGDFGDAADLALSGALAQSVTAYERAAGAGGSPVAALKALEWRMTRLASVRRRMAGGQTSSEAMGALIPRVQQYQAQAFQRQLDVWPGPAAEAALHSILETELRIKRAGSPDAALAARLYLDVARSAAARRR